MDREHLNGKFLRWLPSINNFLTTNISFYHTSVSTFSNISNKNEPFRDLFTPLKYKKYGHEDGKSMATEPTEVCQKN